MHVLKAYDYTYGQPEVHPGFAATHRTVVLRDRGVFPPGFLDRFQQM